MQSSHARKATALVLIAIMLGLLTVQGSYALWNKAADANAGTVPAAHFRIGLTDTETNRFTDMTLSDGTSATISLSTTPAGVVLPGHSTYAGVQLVNATNASGIFTVRASTAVPVVAAHTGAVLAQYLEIKPVAITELSQCADSSLYELAVPDSAAAVDIAKAEKAYFVFSWRLRPTCLPILPG